MSHQKWWVYLVAYSTWFMVDAARQNMVEIFTLKVKTSKLGGTIPHIQCTLYNKNVATILVHEQLSLNILKSFQ